MQAHRRNLLAIEVIQNILCSNFDGHSYWINRWIANKWSNRQEFNPLSVHSLIFPRTIFYHFFVIFHFELLFSLLLVCAYSFFFALPLLQCSRCFTSLSCLLTMRGCSAFLSFGKQSLYSVCYLCYLCTRCTYTPIYGTNRVDFFWRCTDCVSGWH